MRKNAYICFILLVIIPFVTYAGSKYSNEWSELTEYSLSQWSEEYNTRYFYCGELDSIDVDSTIYVYEMLPESFVVELGVLEVGEKTIFVCDDDQELVISNKKGKLIVGEKSIGKVRQNYNKMSLYFVNGKMIVYLDDKKIFDMLFPLERNKKIGVKLSKDKGYVCRYFNCYEPVAFKVADYGAELEEGRLIRNGASRMYAHNVGEKYNLTFPSDIVINSQRSIRFEYRFENSKKENVREMLRARSEISGVFSKSPKNKWIIEFDLYVPEVTVDDTAISECITQIHEGSKHPTFPSFCLRVKSGILYCNIKGDCIRIEDWCKKVNPINNLTTPLLYLEKNRWYHVKVYLKEGWLQEDRPLTKVWVDGTQLFESDKPNSYCYTPQNQGYYDYLKFGIYKSGWVKVKEVEKELQTRAYIFDNYVVKY